MTDVFINSTGCVVTQSHITGDILCRVSGPDCDCLMRKPDPSYASHAEEQFVVIENTPGYLPDDCDPFTGTYAECVEVASIAR